jgi:hypothetical protein
MLMLPLRVWMLCLLRVLLVQVLPCCRKRWIT